MFSTSTSEAIERIDAALDVLAGVDLSALSAEDLIRLAGRCETLARRHGVLAGDIAVAVSHCDISALGGARTKCSPTGCASPPPKPAGAPPRPRRWPRAPA